MAAGPFEQLDLLACGAFSWQMDKNISEASEDLRRQWMDLLYDLANDPSLLGTVAHVLYVGEKPGAVR